MNPLISIIVPAFNAERTLAQTMESVAAQTWKHIEVIVVDDGSSDNTYRIATEAAQANTAVIRQDNRGAAAARNLGLKTAQGDFIMFLDADDLISPNKVSAQMRRLLDSSSRSVASCKWGRFTADGSDISFTPQAISRDLLPLDWLTSAWTGGGMMVTGCWMVPREITDLVGAWNERFEISAVDDAEYFTRVLIASDQVLYCEEAILYYRSGGNSLSQNKSRRAIESMFDNYRLMKANLLNAERTSRTEAAAAANFLQLLYQIYPDHRDIVEKSFVELSDLNPVPLHCLPRKLGYLAKFTGLRNALWIRHYVRRVQRSLS